MHAPRTVFAAAGLAALAVALPAVSTGAARAVAAAPAPTFAQPGDLDATFNHGDVSTSMGPTRDAAEAVAVAPDGRIVAAGTALGAPHGDFAVARYSSDGSADTSFNGTGKVVTPVGTGDDRAYAVAVQPDGKIVVAGGSRVLGQLQFAVVRYNVDGSLDSSFGAGGKVWTKIGDGGSDEAYAVAVQPDGRIVLAGRSFSSVPGQTGENVALARYLPDGTLDPTFGDGGKVSTTFGPYDEVANGVVVQPDGRIVVGGWTVSANAVTRQFAVLRYRADGTLDPTFGGDGRAAASIGSSEDSRAEGIALQVDGKIVLGGWAIADERQDVAVARFTADGALDSSFNGSGTVVTPFGVGDDAAFGVVAQPDGRIVVAGGWHYGATSSVLARYLPTGALDPSFGSGGKVETPAGIDSGFFALARQSDGALVAAGYVTNAYYDQSDFSVARYVGASDPSLDAAPVAVLQGSATQVTGFGFAAGEPVDLRLDGTLLKSSTATAGGSISTPLTVPQGTDPGARVLQAAGRSSGRVTSIRLFVDSSSERPGTLDTSFGSGGKVETGGFGESQGASAVALQPDGRIVVAGGASGDPCCVVALARYLPSGVLDSSFGSGGRVTATLGGGFGANDVAIQRDGRIVVAGSRVSGSSRFLAVARFRANGTLDAEFNGTGVATVSFGDGTRADEGRKIAIQPDGKIVVAGTASNTSSAATEAAVARFNPDGSLDTGFNDTGKVVIAFGPDNDFAAGVALQKDGRILVGSTWYNGSWRLIALARLLPNGKLDPSYGTGGIVRTGEIKRVDVELGTADALALQDDGLLVVAGMTQPNVTSSLEEDIDFALARFKPDGGMDLSFGKSGRAWVEFFADRDDSPHDVEVQADGRILVAGSSTKYPTTLWILARFLPDGRLDPTFGPDGDGRVVTPFGSEPERRDRPTALALQKDGRLLAVGSGCPAVNCVLAAARYHATSVQVPPPVVSTFSPASGEAGTTVTLTGANLGDTTAVRFNGKPAASFDAPSETTVIAVVATGSTTGPITVTTPGGTATSSSPFTVTTGSAGTTLPPGAIAVTTGAVQSGGAPDLAADDETVLTVASNARKKTSWYGRFTGVPNSLSGLTVRYEGRNSVGCTQSVAIRNWSSGAWETLDTRVVGATEVDLAALVPQGSAGAYVKGASGPGEARVRVACSTRTATYVQSADVLTLSYTP